MVVKFKILLMNYCVLASATLLRKITLFYKVRKKWQEWQCCTFLANLFNVWLNRREWNFQICVYIQSLVSLCLLEDFWENGNFKRQKMSWYNYGNFFQLTEPWTGLINPSKVPRHGLKTADVGIKICMTGRYLIQYTFQCHYFNEEPGN